MRINYDNNVVSDIYSNNSDKSNEGGIIDETFHK